MTLTLSQNRRFLPLPRVETLVEGSGSRLVDFGGDGMEGTEGLRASFPPCFLVLVLMVSGWCLPVVCCFWRQCWQRSQKLARRTNISRQKHSGPLDRNRIPTVSWSIVCGLKETFNGVKYTSTKGAAAAASSERRSSIDELGVASEKE